MYLLTAWALLSLFLSLSASTPKRVKVFHFTIDYWRLSVEGPHDCGSDIVCEWTHSSDLKHLRRSFRNSTTSSHSVQLPDDDHDKLITVSVYNIHSWLEKQREYGPATCELPSTLTIAESEESRVRYHKLFDPSFKLFDGFSTTHPSSSITRVYESAYLNTSQFINEGKMYNFSTLIKAAAYVAGDCHKRDNANSNRDAVVLKIRKAGFRVEGLGKCLHTMNPEGISLPTNPEARYDMVVKRQAIGRFMFNMAFENSIEDGYVTEKPFDALISGTVPVYLGDAAHLKALLPHPKAAIFVVDFNGSYSRLADYLTFLSTNEEAYESHREWRKDFTYEGNIRNKPQLQTSWYCDVCRWAATNPQLYQTRKERLKKCPSFADERHRGAPKQVS